MKAVIRIRKEPYYRRDAFERGLKHVGFTVTDLSKVTPDGSDDWLVIWNRQNQFELEADQWEKRGGTVIVAENGYLQKVDKSMYAISVHGHCGAGWFPVGDEDRFTGLGFPLQEPQFHLGGHWLICAQRGVGSREMRSPPQWAEKLAAKFRASGVPARVRPHPGNFPPRTPLTRDLENSAAVCVWSSAAGVRALVEGYDVKHHAPHWICDNVEDSREKRLQRMAHGQWKHEEIAAGEPFARIIERRGEAKW